MGNVIKIESKALYKTLARVALPIALQSLIASSLSLVDNLMVGSLGEAELAAVGVATQIFFVHWMLMFGFTSGTATFMAQFYGVNDLHSIRKTVGLAISVCASISMIFFIGAFFFPENVLRIFTNIPIAIELGAEYVKVGAICLMTVSITVPFTSALRATQQTHLPLVISIIVFATNTFLNYVFIFGSFGAPALGVMGAALATSIARILELILILTVVFVKKNKIAGKAKEYFAWTGEFVARLIRNAIPTTLNETMWGLGTAMYVAAFARVGITEYAAVQASNTINNLFIMAAFSMGDAVLILVGERLGKGELEYSYELAKRLLRIGTFIGGIAGILLIICAKPLVGLFEFTPEGQRYAFLILVVYGLFMSLAVSNGINITGTLRAGGDTTFAMKAEVGSVWLIGVPMAFITTGIFHLPIYVAILCVKMEEVVKSVILIRRFISKKWVKNVIKDL